MRIGLFGGSFNPPHVCHVMATVWALKTRELDEVWWIPANRHAFGKELVPYEKRREMCRYATSGMEGVVISDIERELGGESRTIDTVRALRERADDEEFVLLVGADILEETDEWKDWETLVEWVDVVVVGRGEYADDEEERVAEFGLPDVSSTEIRASLAESRDDGWLQDWVPRDVLDFIDREGLYREGTGE